MAIKGRVRATITRGLRGLIQKEIKMNEFDENRLFATKLVNNSDEGWAIYEKGKRVTVVPPLGESLIESWRPDTDFARWERIVRDKKGRLTLTENTQWSNPWEGKFYCLELINEDASPEETLLVVAPNPAIYGPSDTIAVQRGIPKIVPLNILDPLVKYQKIHWHRVERRTRRPGTRYFQTETEVIKEMVPRSERDLRNVLKERQRIEKERRDEETRKVMEEQEKLLLGDSK